MDFLYQTINIAIFEKSEKKCSRKATIQEQRAAIKGTATTSKSAIKQMDAEQKSIPAEIKRSETERTPEPQLSVLAAKYPRLKEIDNRLKEQNKAILGREKKRLSSIVRECKFDSVQAFYKEFNAAKKESMDYEAACAEYEKIYGEKVVDARSVRNKLKQKEQVVKEREAGRVHQTKQKNQGAR